MIPGYYLGIPPKDCVIDSNVLYYTGTGAESYVKLYFDAYLPPNNGVGLPGGNSTIIRIHGGGWVIGDKSMQGMLQVDKYLAAQGYCVFDIQYGLSNASEGILSSLSFANPSNVIGNFSINDMMSQMGVFCQYLVAHQAEYGANMSSTFISGGSAGGQLTCAVALAIANGSYASYFGTANTALKIRGLIPMYPANGMAAFDQGRSLPEFLDPTLLVNSASPPCLIYQGMQDGLVNPKISQAFKDAYANANNPACALIWLPMAGHGSDLYFSGYYNTFFLYYMERFLYLNR
ncbi:MAG TPA: alpha/beta hydrolase [Candidatus Lokiarchaeia archaeon]|nr:alpha/beta hydrolase [Candidatus Lokiarchaeia archaeon]